MAVSDCVVKSQFSCFFSVMLQENLSIASEEKASGITDIGKFAGSVR
jgi:hypothetical protein